MYQNYQKARDAAWRVLIRYRINRLPVDVKKICAKEGVALFPYSRVKEPMKALGFFEHSKRTDGFSLRHGKRLLLFYNDTTSAQRQRFTIAHELGHYLNGDVTAFPTYRNREPGKKDDPHETAANVTASRILAPACVLWHMGVVKPADIATLCDISLTAAKWRAERLRLLIEREKAFRLRYGRGCFLMSPLERQVFLQFFGNIDGI